MAPSDTVVAEVRSFNRAWTTRLGVLAAGILESPYSLTEARVVFELAQAEALDGPALRRTLDLDPGYLSRILAKFRAAGLVRTGRDPRDGRRGVVALTPAGRRVFEDLDRRADEQVRAMIAPLATAEQRRLVAAMQAVEGLLAGSTPAPVLLRPPEPGDLGWVVHRHGTLYAREQGWDERFEALVAGVVADHVSRRDDPGERAWIAEQDGRPVGSVLCCRAGRDVAQLRLLLVEPECRGQGLGARLVDTCVDFAQGAGYRRIVLWTDGMLVAARRIYEAAGFRLVAEAPHDHFGVGLVGQDWALDLPRADRR